MSKEVPTQDSEQKAKASQGFAARLHSARRIRVSERMQKVNHLLYPRAVYSSADNIPSEHVLRRLLFTTFQVKLLKTLM